MKRLVSASRAAASLFLVVACATTARAQTNERVWEELDFRLVAPGARAAGMGKTFVGLADDATAAFSNPAGLSNLLEEEVSFEFQAVRIKHERLVPGAYGQTERFGDTVVVPSFLSFVLPLGQSTLSLFSNRIQDYREEFQFAGRFVDAIGTYQDGAFGTIAVKNDTYGLGFSYVFTPYLSFGGSLVYSTIDVATSGRSGTPLNPRNGTDTNDTDARLTGIAGMLLKPSRTVSVGMVYYAGATYTLQTTLFGSFLERGVDVVRTGEERLVEYVVPRRFALGASWRMLDGLTLVADATRVMYSDLVTDRFLVVDYMDTEERLSAANFSVRDVWELHAGAEYRHYLAGVTLAVRAGVFTDPDHRLQFTPTNDRQAQKVMDYQFNTIDQETDLGYTFGGGVAVGRTQVDIAVSLSPDRDEVTVSMVFRH